MQSFQDDEERAATAALLEAIAAARTVLSEPAPSHGNSAPKTSGGREASVNSASHHEGEQVANLRKAQQRKVAGLSGALKRAESERDEALKALAQLRQGVDSARANDATKDEVGDRQSASNVTTRALEKKVSELEDAQDLLKLTVTELTALKKQHLKQISELERAVGLTSDDDRVSAMRSQISELTTDAIQREKNLMTKDHVISELRQKVTEQRDIAAHKESEAEDLKTKLVTVESDLELSNQQLQSRMKAMDVLESDRKELRARINQMTIHATEMDRSHERQLEGVKDLLSNSNREVDEFKKQGEDLRTKLRAAESSVRTMSLQNNTLLDKLDRAQRSRKTILSRATTQRATALLVINRLRTLQRWVAMTHQRVTRRQRETLGTARTDQQLTAAKLESLQRESQRMKEAHQSEVTSLKSEVEQANETQSELRRTCSQLEVKQGAEAEELRRDASRTAKEIQALRSQLMDAEDKCSDLEAAALRSEEVEYWKGRTDLLEKTSSDLQFQLERRRERFPTPTPEQEEAERKAGTEVAEMRQLIDGLHDLRARDATILQTNLASLDEAHRRTILDWEGRCNEARDEVEKLKVQFTTAEKNGAKLAQQLSKKNDEVQKLTEQLDATPERPPKDMAMLKDRAVAMARRLRKEKVAKTFHHWLLEAARRKNSSLKLMAQRSFKALQTKADTLRGIADDAVARNTELEHKLKVAEEELQSSPRRIPRTTDMKDVVDVLVQTEGETELEEAKQKAEHYFRKAKDLTKLMETARTQIQSIVQELRGFKERETQFIEEVQTLSRKLEMKDEEIHRLKTEMRKTLGRWSEGLLANDQSEFASWLLATRAPLVRDLCQMLALTKHMGGAVEKGVQHIICKYLTDPEKHHHGIGLIADPEPQPESVGRSGTATPLPRKPPTPAATPAEGSGASVLEPEE